jgi:hypothetical protein
VWDVPSHAYGVRASARALESTHLRLASAGSFGSWKRVEYVMNRVDKLMVVECGAVMDPGEDRSRAVLVVS